MSRSGTNGPAHRLEEFLGDKRHCDIVMKGGITSGVVYPLAVIELAKKFRFKNVGGASAGAIAAAFAAAAEYGRETGGFLRLAEIADEISAKLRTLFQPTPQVARVFRAIFDSIELPSTFARVRKVLLALCGGWTPLLIGTAALSTVAAILWIVIGFRSDLSPRSLVLTSITSLLVAVLAFILTLVVRVLFKTRAHVRQLERQGFGMCPGTRQGSDAPDALVEWLHDRINYVAGLDRDGPPLTFGYLHGNSSTAPATNLEVMTTNLTAGCPYRIPFREKGFFFRERELREVLPVAVVDWMVTHARPYEHDESFLRLPETQDLPVVFAVRLSLSFPLLLSAVPLYARDFVQLDESLRHVPRRCWFSDGGICSNFPIHFFDNVLPRCPTFGITLEPYLPTHHKSKVWLPGNAASGILRPLAGDVSLPGFLWSIVGTAMDWRDTMQSCLPGYRERIVHVRLDSVEGGLNLNMPAERVVKLMDYGKSAGQKLRDDFNWDEHRWKRFLVWVAELEEILENLRTAYLSTPTGDTSNAEFLASYRSNPTCYESNGGEWFDAATANLRDLLACFEDWQQRRPGMRDGKIPKPEVDARLTPRI